MAKLSSDKKSVTVQKGDTLSEIASTYKSYISGSTNAARIQTLVKLNGIENPDYIVVGQIIVLSGAKAATAAVKNTTPQATVTAFGLQANTDRTVYATWKWDKDHTKEYQVKWYYATGDGVWFDGTSTAVTTKQSTYNAPSNATKVKFKVKPVSKTHKVNGKDTVYWTATWSTEKKYEFKNNPPTTPAVPTVTIDNFTLTAELSNLDVNGTHIEFQIVKNDKSVFNTGKAEIKKAHASYSCTVTAGATYTVRCRALRGDDHSDWTQYSGAVGTIPAASKGFKTIKALSATEVQLDWYNVSNAEGYELQYTKLKRYFDSNPSEVKSITVDSVVGHAEATGLESGNQYFFRVRATNKQGSSAWTEIVSIIIGKAPAAPTTWSSTTTAITGEPLNLYWVHNTEDGSSQTYAQLALTIGGVTNTYDIKNTANEDEKDKTSCYSVNTSPYNEGTQIRWKVRTAGITNTYGEWSVERTVDIYAPPTLELGMTDSSGNSGSTLTAFPFYISALAGPNTQQPIGYHVSITANEIYETIDPVGNTKIVNKGEAVYSKYFDTTSALRTEFSANNIDLENNIHYTVTCTVSMNSGLTAEARVEFVVAWSDMVYAPNAEIGIDEETLTAMIRPYCEYYPPVYYKVEYNSEKGVYNATSEEILRIAGSEVPDIYTEDGDVIYQYTTSEGTTAMYCIRDADGTDLVEGVTLSVYRREFDGSFVELATGLNNTSNTYITDPHPALDYARYRVVAIATDTGAVSYYDVPGYPVGEKAAVIQWDEDWSYFETDTEDELEQPPWSGSMLKLPYNLDVSDSRNADVSTVKYIGRKRPVSYYGTQLGETANWNMVIEKDDKETLYALRRLSIWMGDVYVREPSGSGYWATVKVSFSQKHKDLTIPVTIDITRVEGGA